MFPSWVCFILTSRQFMLLSSSFWCFRRLLGPQLSKQQIHVLSLIQPALHLKPQSPGEASYQDKRSTKRTMQWEVQFTGNGQQYGQTRFLDDNKKQIQTMDRSLMTQVRKVLCFVPWDCDIFNSPANNRKVCNVFATRPTTDFLCAYAELWKAFSQWLTLTKAPAKFCMCRAKSPRNHLPAPRGRVAVGRNRTSKLEISKAHPAGPFW